MGNTTRICTLGFFSLAFLTSTSIAWSVPDTSRYAGIVLDIDKTAQRIVVGDMGPLLDNGKSEIIRRNVQVTPFTKFASVKRTSGPAPSGWIGDYVEAEPSARDVRPGDFVTITVKSERRDSEALNVTVVDTSEPETLGKLSLGPRLNQSS